MARYAVVVSPLKVADAKEVQQQSNPGNERLPWPDIGLSSGVDFERRYATSGMAAFGISRRAPVTGSERFGLARAAMPLVGRRLGGYARLVAEWRRSAGGPTDDTIVAAVVDDHRLGRLAPVDVRTVWSSESADFTPWLASNLQLLGDALGIDELELVQREVPVGPFLLDLLAKDAEGRTVAIENQLMPSEHGHLGQLLVCAAGRRADVVVWVATRFKEEYRAVLDWLNEHTDPDLAFFGVELRVVRIGSSAPAPIFDVVVQPNDWGKAQKAQRQGTHTVSTVVTIQVDPPLGLADV